MARGLQPRVHNVLSGAHTNREHPRTNSFESTVGF